MLIVDIGNSFAHIYNNGKIEHLEHRVFFENYLNSHLYYINVNPTLSTELEQNSNWINLSPFVYIDGEYIGMGVDRRVLLLAGDDGIYIDAGSAITIDKKIDNKFVGGMIIPGLKYIKESYGNISSKLAIDNLEIIDLSILPNSNSKDAVNYGAIAPIVSIVNSINKENLPIYCSGGDGAFLADILKAKFDEALIFEGMKRVIKERLC